MSYSVQYRDLLQVEFTLKITPRQLVRDPPDLDGGLRYTVLVCALAGRARPTNFFGADTQCCRCLWEACRRR